MLNVVCVNAGNYLGRGADYVNILADMVGRNISKKTIYKFICFTDSPTGYDPGVDVRPLPVEGLGGWWNKLSLFKDDIFPDGDRILYLDLDTIIVGGLDKIIEYSGEFAILRDFYRPKGLQSSVMAWGAGKCSYIWDKWLDAGKPEIDGGDQSWIEKCVKRFQLWQDLYPDCFVSYKVHAKREIPIGAKIVVFHGLPRPHEVTIGWMPYVWKTGGGTTLEMEYQCNTEFKQVADNIKSAMKRDLPWIKMEDMHDGHAVIVGGGPSLKTQLQNIRDRQEHGQKIFATNGAYKYLEKNGIKPDFHVMLDAREENIKFVPKGAQCYYSSRLAPVCIDAALKSGNVTLWHPWEDGIQDIVDINSGIPFVGGGTSVGMRSIGLAYTLGYRNFHLYGFDSSYEGKENHAYRQALNDDERTLTVQMNGKDYFTAAWMCTQVEEFKVVAQELVNTGCILTVHGYGLLPDVARVMVNTESPVDIRVRELLSRLDIKNPVGAEIGVFAGNMSCRLLDRLDLTLYMVDHWGISDRDSAYVKTNDFHATLSQKKQDEFYESAVKAVKFADDRARIIRKSSVNAANDIADKSLDFVFIDADHSYEGCKADIEAWYPKLKDGGLLSGHDYKNDECPGFGVERAVEEFCKENNLTLEIGGNYTWFVRIPVASETKEFYNSQIMDVDSRKEAHA